MLQSVFILSDCSHLVKRGFAVVLHQSAFFPFPLFKIGSNIITALQIHPEMCHIRLLPLKLSFSFSRMCCFKKHRTLIYLYLLKFAMLALLCDKETAEAAVPTASGISKKCSTTLPNEFLPWLRPLCLTT